MLSHWLRAYSGLPSCLLVHGRACICSFITGLQRNLRRVVYDTHKRKSHSHLHGNRSELSLWHCNLPQSLQKCQYHPPDAQNRQVGGIPVHTLLFISSYIIFTLKYVSVCISSLYFCCDVLCLLLLLLPSRISRVRLFGTPRISACQASLSITNSRVHSNSCPSSWWSHPAISSPSPPAPIPSQHQSLFQWVNSSHEVAKVLEFQL